MAQIPEGSESQVVEALVAVLSMIVSILVAFVYYIFVGVRYSIRVGWLLYARGRRFQCDPAVQGRVARAVQMTRSTGAAIASYVGNVANTAPAGGPIPGRLLLS